MEKQAKLILGVFMIAFMLIAAAATAQPPHSGKKGYKKEYREGQPAWAPAHGYRAKMRPRARHIYYPEHDVYYDRRREVYIYADMGRWRVSARIPLPLRERESERGWVALDDESEWPQRDNAEHRSRYLR